jgi:hypothetical protein
MIDTEFFSCSFVGVCPDTSQGGNNDILSFSGTPIQSFLSLSLSLSCLHFEK